VTDGLLGLLSPLAQLTVGVCALIVFVISIRRLAQRGKSRMTTAVLVTGVAALTVAALDFLLQYR
jgi:multisubunit Na+/H+ antiporter MnhB subunit